jgi:hypothetical protein
MISTILCLNVGFVRNAVPTPLRQTQRRKTKKDRAVNLLYPSGDNCYSCFFQFVIIDIKTN